MNAALRQTLSALGVVAIVALSLGGAASIALSLREQRASVAAMTNQIDALDARAKRLASRSGRDPNASPFFEAKSITLAGAALQQRLEGAVTAARGRLVSSEVDVVPRGDDRRIALSAEMTIAEPGIQALLFDLETGRPYLFVDSIEARAPGAANDPKGGAMRVSLTISGQWSGAK